MADILNLAVFASTKGTDLQAVIEAIKSGQLKNVDLKFVLSNRSNCYAMQRAEQAGIKTIFIDPKNKTREEFDQACLDVCLQEKIDLILLIGYMRLISSVLVKPYKNKIINIHPSLLPKYPGMDLDVHQAVIDAGERETGCSLHYVDQGMDTGKIILQSKVTVDLNDTPETLKQKVQAKEQEIILEGLKQFAKN